MRRTKIICTLGPSTDKGDILRQLMIAGMDVARLNFSHQTHKEQKVRVDQVKKLREELHLPIALLLDTKGPEIRLKEFSEPKVFLEAGAHFTLTSRDVMGMGRGASRHLLRGSRVWSPNTSFNLTLSLGRITISP